jgi:3-methyl-2-oxobutanoate hydroxymethyltransferase
MRLTVRDIQKMKTEGKPIAMMTAYDAISARLSEAAGVDMILVGDTLGMVVQGHDSTIPVTLDQMIYHAEIVARVTEKPLIVGDMPFMSVQVSIEQALKNCARMMQEAHVTVVKVEGGEFMAPTIARLVEAGIPVMAHIGLTPQSVNKFGGFHVQGKKVDSAQQLIRDAEAVQDAGAFAVVLELTPTPLSQIVTQRLHIPTIGIGAGIHCDGQVQVFHDILDLYQIFQPKHAKQYTNAGDVIRKGIEDFVQEVRNREFPTEKQSFSMKEEELTTLRAELDKEKVNGSRRNH